MDTRENQQETRTKERTGQRSITRSIGILLIAFTYLAILLFIYPPPPLKPNYILSGSYLILIALVLALNLSYLIHAIRHRQPQVAWLFTGVVCIFFALFLNGVHL